jgi:transcriptional regulator with XRE-family HTH domain
MPGSLESVSSIGKVFGASLKKYRKALQLKQEAIGQAIGCSKSTISEIENGKHTPHLDNAVAIAEFFGVPLDALVKENDQHSEATVLLTLRQMAMGCPEEQRKTIAAYCRTFADALEAS